MKNILIITKDPDPSFFRKALSAGSAYRIRLVRSGPEASDAAESPDVDLVLLDCNIYQGNYFVKAAAEILGKRDIPLIFITDKELQEVPEALRDSRYGFVYRYGGEGYLLSAVDRALKLFEIDKARSEGEGRYRVIFNQANDAIHISDTRGRIVDVNPQMCDLMGYTKEEILSLKIYDLMAPEDRIRDVAVIEAHLALYGNSRCEGVNIHRDGHRIPVEISIAKVKERTGDYYISIVRDITERKKTEEHLRKKQG